MFDELLESATELQRTKLCDGFAAFTARQAQQQAANDSMLAANAAQAATKIFHKRIAVAGVCAVIGCIACGIGYYISHWYAEDAADNEQEDDEEENQKTQQEANAEQVTNA